MRCPRKILAPDSYNEEHYSKVCDETDHSDDMDVIGIEIKMAENRRAGTWNATPANDTFPEKENLRDTKPVGIKVRNPNAPAGTAATSESAINSTTAATTELDNHNTRLNTAQITTNVSVGKQDRIKQLQDLVQGLAKQLQKVITVLEELRRQ